MKTGCASAPWGKERVSRRRAGSPGNGGKKDGANRGLKLNVALNYGSRGEVVRAANLLVARGKPVSEADLMNALYTAGLPDLDLVIRTGGEQRLSNFLLLQAAYAELVFVQDYFPDFTDERYVDCLREYQRRNRRFGALQG